MVTTRSTESRKPQRAFALIGPGRAGGALHHALVDRGWEHRGTYRKGDPVSASGANVDVVFIATPDGLIEHVAKSIEPRADTIVAHLAGSLGLDVLAPHPRRAALHPLVSGHCHIRKVGIRRAQPVIVLDRDVEGMSHRPGEGDAA